jgi:subtilase family protein/MAM domain-containing protein meprin/A5/mu/flagellar hook capping protein FlgD
MVPLRLILLFCIISGIVFAQIKTNTQKLIDFSRQKLIEQQTEKTNAVQFAIQNGIPIREESANGIIIDIQKIVNGIPFYYITDNVEAAKTTSTDLLYPSGGLGLSLTGSGYSALGEWDGGAVRTTHQEFGSRVTQVDGATSISGHATHVAGTMIASGVDAAARGMAYQANLDAYDWNSDESEMASAAASGLEVSNHSYSFITGWYQDTGANWHWYGDVSIDQDESFHFGFYDAQAQDWDQIAYDAPYYLIIKSSGNDRNDTAPIAGTAHSHSGIGTYFDTHNDDGFDNGGYDVIRGAGVSKNILSVGAVNDLPLYTTASDVVMSDFSCWGPADDGRIKPDIVGNGVYLYSSYSTNNSAYEYSSGTSMSSPNVTGSLALLQQHYQNTHSGNSMLSATLKGLILHSAYEAGNYPGPDYEYGWGLLNSEQAAQVISENQSQNVIDELSLSNGSTYSRSVTVTGDNPGPLKVTICWTDLPGTPVADALDPTNTMLVNDLDLRIIKDATTYYPWKLDVSDPSLAATNNSENNVDNVEQVYIANPVSGTYTITIDHDGTLITPQDFSIIISGIDEHSSAPSSCSASLITPTDGATGVSLKTTIKWAAVNDASSYDFYFGTDTPPTNIVNGTNLTATTFIPTLSGNTTYFINVVPRNSQGSNTSCTTIWSFTTESQTVYSTFPVIENFDGFTEPGGIGTGNDWENVTNDNFDWDVISGITPTGGSYDTGPSGDHTSGSGNYLYTESSTPNYPDMWAILNSPFYDFSTLANPTLEFWYHSWDGFAGLGCDFYVDVFNSGIWHNVFSVTGDQGNEWHVETIDLMPYKSGGVNQIRFRGKTNYFTNDMAIDDFQIRSEAFHTYPTNNTSDFVFDNTNVSIQFSSGNSGEVTLIVVENNNDPGIFGSLPGSVINVSTQKYWDVTLNSGTVTSSYNMTLDLNGMQGISDYSSLYLLRRTDNTNPWEIVGTNVYIGSGTEVTWTGITGGFSEFTIGGAGDNSLPVTLTSFNAESSEDGILLDWITESEIENLGFILQRKSESDIEWQIITDYTFNEAMKGKGNSSSRSDYWHVDENVEIGNQYEYRIADVSYTGAITYLKTIEIEFTDYFLPKNFVLKNAYPNPFNPFANIRYGLPKASEVNITIFDITGRKIKTLINSSQEAGWYDLNWNGTNEQNNKVSSGMYLYKMTARNFNSVKKILLIR